MGIHYQGKTLCGIKTRPLHKLKSFQSPGKKIPETTVCWGKNSENWEPRGAAFHRESKRQKTRALCTDHEETAKAHRGKGWTDFNCDEGGGEINVEWNKLD